MFSGNAPVTVKIMLKQIEWLKEAGFDEVDCLSKHNRSAIIGGFRHHN